MNRLSRFVLAASIGVAPAWVLAQGTRKPAPAKPRVPASRGANVNQTGNVIIRNSPQGTAEYDDKLGIARLTKDVTVVQTGEKFILRSQILTYSRPQNTALATGSLRIDTRDSTLRGEQLRGDFDGKTFYLDGNVVISAHGKKDGVAPDSKNLRSELESKPVKIACNQAVWDYDTQQATLGGNIRMVQEKTVGTCDRIKYDERQNIVLLEGGVRFTDAGGNTIESDEIVFYVDSGRVVIKGGPAGRPELKFPNRDFNTPGKTAKVTPKPRETYAPPPTIPDNILDQFNRTPAPIAPPRARTTATPEPTEAPEPDEVVTEPTTAPETPETPLENERPNRRNR